MNSKIILFSSVIFFSFLFFGINDSAAEFGDQKNDGLNFMERMLFFVTKKSPEKSIPESIRDGLPKLYQKHLIINNENSFQAANDTIVEFLNRLNNPDSVEYKLNSNLSLARSLRIHGLPSLQIISDEEIVRSKIDVRKLLILQSEKNKKRILKEMNFHKDQVLKLLTMEELDLINKLQIIPLHRSCNRLVKSKFETPLISSRQLGHLGLVGANTRYAFNREYLQSDDNIFFRAELVNAGSLEVEANKETEYGNNSISVESNFAHEYAFLSPFLMYSTDLHQFARLQNKKFDDENKDFYKYSNALESVEHPDPELSKIFYQVMDPYKNELYLFDLTFQDYEDIVHAVLLKSLFIVKMGETLEIVDENPFFRDFFSINYDDLLRSLRDGKVDIQHLSKIMAKIPEHEF
jgi:hypothetical protein